MAAFKKKKIIKKKVVKKKVKAVKIKTVVKKRVAKKKFRVFLKRALHNPIIEPRLYPWESKATFNPAAFEAKGKVHLIYRAIGDNDFSALGYAASSDGYNINERLPYFIYQRSNAPNSQIVLPDPICPFLRLTIFPVEDGMGDAKILESRF